MKSKNSRKKSPLAHGRQRRKKTHEVFVCVNMASSIDGKIATKKRGFVKFSSPYDSLMMQRIRAQADAVVMGARTFRAYPKPLLVRRRALLRARLRHRKSAEPATVLISSRLDFPRNTPWEKATDQRRIVFCTTQAPLAARLRLAKRGVEVIVWPGRRPSPKFILKKLAAMGMHSILLEGGGELNAAFFEEDLVNRIYLTFCPVLLGGRDSPTIFEGNGFPLKLRQHWILKSSLRVGHELYLTYDRRGV